MITRSGDDFTVYFTIDADGAPLPADPETATMRKVFHKDGGVEILPHPTPKPSAEPTPLPG